MQFYTSYVQQLENLIVNVLLPVYEKYNKDMDEPNLLLGINPELIEKVKSKKQVAALLCKKLS
jgi:hypothetical protein